jgi:dTDP-4-amino-4,6-dideoxygalactose transaminase
MITRSIPFFSLDRQVKNLYPHITEALAKVLDSQQFIGGSFVASCEKSLSHYLESEHVISCNSGTDALWLAIKAFDVKPNDIVLTTPFSFIASSSEIAAHRGIPVFIDVEEDTYNINPILMARWLTENATIKNGATVHKKTGFPIVGIVSVDLFGQCANYDAIKTIANEWKLWIIEDTAQAIGAGWKGKKAGTLGDVGCFSFYPTKNLGAFGDAGCCCTDNPKLAQKILELRNHGRISHYQYLHLGINSRLDGFQAAVLSEKLRYLDGWNNRRREIAARYTKELSHLPFIKTPIDKTGSHVYHQYSVVVENRDAVQQHVESLGVQTRVFYPQSLPEIPFLQTNEELTTHCPVSQKLVQSILALPIWPELEDDEVTHVIDAFKSITPVAFASLNQGKQHGLQK